MPLDTPRSSRDCLRVSTTWNSRELKLNDKAFSRTLFVK